MPESMSIERRRLMAAYGAKLELTPRAKGMPGAIARAEEMVRSSGGTAWMPSQFDNRANVAVHEETTAREIVEDFGAQNLPTHYITGVGTGGHLTGVARVLKAKKPGCKVFAVEPQDSPVISGGSPSPHPIQGVRAWLFMGLPECYVGLLGLVHSIGLVWGCWHVRGDFWTSHGKKKVCLSVYACLAPRKDPALRDLSRKTHTQIGAGFIPKNLDTSLLDGVIQVSKEEAFEMTKRAAKEEGILAGISSGATLAAW